MKAKVIEIDRDAMREERMKPDDYRGATLERVQRAQEHVSVGDDRMGARVYQFLDSPLDRLYARLSRAPKVPRAEKLGFEYAALRKYERLFVESGMIGSVGSIDFNRAYSPTPFGRSHTGSTERQCDDRLEYQRARYRLGHKEGIVVDNFVCFGNSLEISGYCVGMNSKTQAIRRAQDIVRDSGYELAVMWGMVR